MAVTKSELRARARARRRTFHATPGWHQANATINELLQDLIAANTSGPEATIAAYYPYGDEPDILPTLHWVRDRGGRVLLPRLGQGLTRSWAAYECDGEVVVQAPNRPPSPTGPDLGAAVLAQAQVVIVPALGIDLAGTRLGQGAGWYDRVLTHRAPEALLVGVVFAADVATQPLPVADHDVAVQSFITEAGVQTLAPQ